MSVSIPSGIVPALDRRAEDVAERGPRVGRAVLFDRLLLLGDLARLDREPDPPRLRVDRNDTGIDVITLGEALRPLLGAVAASGLAQLAGWTRAASYGAALAFAAPFGFFSGCFLSLAAAVAAAVFGAERLAGLSGLVLLFNAPGASCARS